MLLDAISFMDGRKMIMLSMDDPSVSCFVLEKLNAHRRTNEFFTTVLLNVFLTFMVG